MTARIRLPANMRALADGSTTVDLTVATVGEALAQLIERYPKLEPRLRDSKGEPPSFINIFVNETSIRELSGLETLIPENSEVLILAALAGG